MSRALVVCLKLEGWRQRKEKSKLLFFLPWASRSKCRAPSSPPAPPSCLHYESVVPKRKKRDLQQRIPHIEKAKNMEIIQIAKHTYLSEQNERGSCRRNKNPRNAHATLKFFRSHSESLLRPFIGCCYHVVLCCCAQAIFHYRPSVRKKNFFWDDGCSFVCPAERYEENDRFLFERSWGLFQIIRGNKKVSGKSYLI